MLVTRATNAPMQPRASERICRRRAPHWSSLRLRGGTSFIEEVDRLTKLVENQNACALPGCKIKFDTFMSVMWRAVARGFVRHDHAAFVAQGLRNGFTAGVQRDQLKGQRIFKNYKSAVAAMGQVGRATQARINLGKTICLGDWAQIHEKVTWSTLR